MDISPMAYKRYVEYNILKKCSADWSLKLYFSII